MLILLKLDAVHNNLKINYYQIISYYQLSHCICWQLPAITWALVLPDLEAVKLLVLFINCELAEFKIALLYLFYKPDINLCAP